MMKLKKMVLKEAHELNDYQMKKILGGTNYTTCALNSDEDACKEEKAKCTTTVLGISAVGECRFSGGNLIGSKSKCTCIVGID